MYLSMQDIINKYNGQWVFLINCKVDDNDEIIGGEVVLNDKLRDKVISEMESYLFEESDTILTYVGKIPEGISLLL
ncbi:MAG: hypothetical protein FWC47_06735 [Oscillospiraceae bacterium]|nr:hypothetical protein [Oscillospiraceae bacterium]